MGPFQNSKYDLSKQLLNDDGSPFLLTDFTEEGAAGEGNCRHMSVLAAVLATECDIPVFLIRGYIQDDHPFIDDVHIQGHMWLEIIDERTDGKFTDYDRILFDPAIALSTSGKFCRTELVPFPQDEDGFFQANGRFPKIENSGNDTFTVESDCTRPNATLTYFSMGYYTHPFEKPYHAGRPGTILYTQKYYRL